LFVALIALLHEGSHLGERLAVAFGPMNNMSPDDLWQINIETARSVKS